MTLKNELVAVGTNENGNPVVDGRELHDFLQVATPFGKWMPRMIEYGFIENVDYFTEDKNVRRADGRIMPQTTKEYTLSLDMAKEISMVQRNERGMMARNHFLEIEKKWNSPEQVMARALLMANSRIEALQGTISLLEPKARECEKFIEHGHIIGLRELAKELKIRHGVLSYIVNDILGWRYKSGKRYVPYQQTIIDGYMAAYDDCYNDEKGITGVRYGFTIKGRMRVEEELEKLKANNIVPIGIAG